MGNQLNVVSHAVVVQASGFDDLDNAVAHVQKEAGISTGDAAGRFFADAVEDPDEWASYTPLQRVGLLINYLDYERNLVGQVRSPANSPGCPKAKHIRLFQVRYCGDIRHDEDGCFDVIFHDADSVLSSQRYSPETFATYEEAVIEADRLDEAGARPTDWSMAYAL
ncbi:MAG: hypothetical protein CMK74_20350 [Pseudomonadales bacterium]|nr:hypothetical protein [Pseudomonadales bacterium]|tara:strand:- start:307 stop:804 length:498 start_codon:yes stop_codon:yes gene_type:complete